MKENTYEYKNAILESPCYICSHKTKKYPVKIGASGLLYLCSEECYLKWQKIVKENLK